MTQVVVRDYLNEPLTLYLDPLSGGPSAIYTDGTCAVVGPLSYYYTIDIVDSQGVSTSSGQTSSSSPPAVTLQNNPVGWVTQTVKFEVSFPNLSG